jgi:chromate transporter
VAFAITLATAAIAYWTRLNPLWMFAAAGILGYLGYV